MGKVDSFGLGLQPNGDQKTAAAGPTLFPPVTAEGIEADIARLEHEATIGSRAPERQKRGGKAYGGDVEGGCRPLSFGGLLTMAYGEPVSSTQPDAVNAPTVYRHIWNPLAAGKKPMPATLWTVNADDPDEIIVDEYVGAMMDELAWTIEANDYLLYTATIAAIRQIEGGVAPVATRDSTELWSFDEIGAEIAIPSINAGAYQPVALYDWGHSYGNQLSGGDRFQIGSKEAVKLRPGNIAATVTATFAEDLESHYRRALADFPELVKMRLNAIGRELYDGGAVPANALYESLSVEFMGLEYNSGNVPINASEPLEDIEVEANCVIDGSGNLLTITLTNEHDGSKYRAPVV